MPKVLMALMTQLRSSSAACQRDAALGEAGARVGGAEAPPGVDEGVEDADAPSRIVERVEGADADSRAEE